MDGKCIEVCRINPPGKSSAEAVLKYRERLINYEREENHLNRLEGAEGVLAGVRDVEESSRTRVRLRSRVIGLNGS